MKLLVFLWRRMQLWSRFKRFGHCLWHLLPWNLVKFRHCAVDFWDKETGRTCITCTCERVFSHEVPPDWSLHIVREALGPREHWGEETGETHKENNGGDQE